ncbi:ubiquitin carboxyl-terminal hydrolase 47 isoform X2 [Thrips palmi]|uniref:Ubiquitin carboxyl-terminal hydrolase 47 n=1 Tax=Thrips palmi TaxID=161013 RepID=A0A6P8YEQ1_THRPL|nr:ubiquitin carboxyl-terminal hydrolase 47 isoform X2 [Thrips palmi]
MVLLLEDDPAIIRVMDEMPEGSCDKKSYSLPPSSSVQELYTTVMNGCDYSPDSCTLLVTNDHVEFEVKRDDEQSLKDAGLSLGSSKQNILKIVPRESTTPPSIVISLANKGEDSNDANADIVNGRQTNSLRARTRMKMRESDRSYVGLVNQAMTCYLNSLLQALFMTPEFRNSLYKWEFIGSPEETPKSIPFQLQKLFLSLQTSSRSAVETSKLTRSFGWDASDSWQQHDIQELCRVMFDALEQKFKDTDQADFINNLYQGKLIDYVTCLECKTEKTRIDTFLDIPLPVRPFGSTVAYNSVAEAMHAFIQPEILDGNNQYFCETCNKKCDAHKGLKFSHFPYILTLHLKRFDFDYNAMTRIKLTDRVEFPNFLNINGYLCEEARTLLVKQESTVLEQPPSPVNDEDSSDRSVKGDDTSTTDSASTVEDEGCQAAGTLHGSTSGSNSSGSNVDMQDFDEGIDLRNGTNQDDNENNRRQTEGSSSGPPGPYVYELFAIMIHSGSASGGHYYVYIKDFEKDKWFCFDDQSVTRITNEDISMTYGGGSHRSYYSGAHSSSTNAYMLMYRQIDKKRNQSAMLIDEFPPHIKALVEKMQKDEEEEKMYRERDKDRLKIKVFCFKPGEKTRSETKLVIDGDTTLADATAIAHQLFSLESVVPLEQCRLVSYDNVNEAIDISFDGQDGETMNSIYLSMPPCAQSLFLEIRDPDSQFEPYCSGGVSVKVHKVDIGMKEVALPVEVRVNKSSFAEMKKKIARALKLSSNIKVMVEEYGRGLVELNYEDSFQNSNFYLTNKVFVAEIPEHEAESDFLEKLTAIIEGYSNTITFYCTLPNTDKESLAKLGITPMSGTEECRTLKCEASGDSNGVNKGVSRGTSPQLPPLEGEEECQGATGFSDQSTSEDSSLTDSDRTIVGDEADYCLAELSSSSNSPPGSDQACVSSPEDKDLPPLVRMRKPEKLSTTQLDNGYISDEELWNGDQYQIKIFPCNPDKHDNQNVVGIVADHRMVLGTVRSALARHMGVSPESVKLFRHLPRSKDWIRYASLNLGLPLTSLRDEENLIVHLERALKKGEYRGKVYQLLADDEAVKFLCDWIVAKDMLVGEAKKEILDELKKKHDLDIPFDRCRLRGKKWKDPGKIYLDSQSFQDLQFDSNWEMFLQELDEPENVTSTTQVTVMLKRFSITGRSVDDFHEITIQSPSFSELKEIVSDISGIPLESLQFACPSGSFPFMQCQTKQREIKWDCEYYSKLEDGIVLYYRNKDEDGTSNTFTDGVSSNSCVRMLCRKKRNKDDAVSSDSREAGLRKKTDKYRRDGNALRIVVSPTPSKETSGLAE